MDSKVESNSVKKSPTSVPEVKPEEIGWAAEQVKKLKEFGGFVITLILDGAYVLFASYITESVKDIMEKNILHASLEQDANTELYIVYKLSQILVISLSVIYVLLDIFRYIRKAYKALKE